MRRDSKQDWSPRDPGTSATWEPTSWPEDESDRVIFRKWKDDKQIMAIFPDLEEGPGLYRSYMHVGQHGAASRQVIWQKTVPATLQEYRALAYELEASVGYHVRPIKRWPARA